MSPFVAFLLTFCIQLVSDKSKKFLHAQYLSGAEFEEQEQVLKSELSELLIQVVLPPR